MSIKSIRQTGKKKLVPLRKQSTCISDTANSFFPTIKQILTNVIYIFSSSLAVPEAGDLLRREGPGLLDPVSLMPDDRE